MNKYFRIFPGMIGLIFAIILLGIGIIKDINKVKIEESCDKITATLSNVLRSWQFVQVGWVLYISFVENHIRANE